MFNLAKWNELPKTYKAILTAACHQANTIMQAKYDVLNVPALKRLVGGGAQLRPFPQDVMEASFRASTELYNELSGRNADFKAGIDAMRAFRGDSYLWWQVAEYTFDTFMIRSRARG